MADVDWALRLRDRIGTPAQADGTVRFAADAPGLRVPGRVHKRIGNAERGLLENAALADNFSWIWVMCNAFWIACRSLVENSGCVSSGLVRLGGCSALYDTVCANILTLSLFDREDGVAVRILAALIDAGASLHVGVPVFAEFVWHRPVDVPTSAGGMLRPTEPAQEIFDILLDCALFGSRRPRLQFRRDCEKILRWLPHVPEKILAVIRAVADNDGNCNLSCCVVLLEAAADPPPSPAELLPAEACYGSAGGPDWVDRTRKIRRWLDRAGDWGRRMAWVGAVARAGSRRPPRTEDTGRAPSKRFRPDGPDAAGAPGVRLPAAS